MASISLDSHKRLAFPDRHDGSCWLIAGSILVSRSQSPPIDNPDVARSFRTDQCPKKIRRAVNCFTKDFCALP